MVQEELDHASVVPARRVAELQVRGSFAWQLGDEANIAQDAIVKLFDAVQRGEDRELVLVVFEASFSAAYHIGNF